MTANQIITLLQHRYRCPMCRGTGITPGLSWEATCTNCQGKGYTKLSFEDAFIVAFKNDLIIPTGFSPAPDIEEKLKEFIYAG